MSLPMLIPASPQRQQQQQQLSSPSSLSSSQQQQQRRQSVYSHSAVYVNPSFGSRDENAAISGLLTLEEDLRGTASRYWLTWTPNYLLNNYQSDFLDLKTSIPLSVSSETPTKEETYAVRTPLEHIHTIKRKGISPLGKPHLIVQLRNGLAYPPFHFNDGDTHSFFIALRKVAEISRSIADYDLFYIHCFTSTESQHHHFTAVSSSPSALTSPSSSYSEPSLSAKLQNTSRTLFAKMTDAARDGLDWLDGVETQSSTNNRRLSQNTLANGGSDNMSGDNKLKESNSDAMLEHFTSVGSFELLDGDNDDIQPIPRENPVTLEEWNTYFEEDGRAKNLAELNRRVFYGGLADDARKTAWKYLLYYYPFDATHEERKALVEKKREEYFVYKNQWTSITPEQESHFSDFVERRNCVEKDVIRTDRTQAFFEGEGNENLKLLSDILLTYSTFNFDLGYVQGMNDLLSVVLMVMEGDEVDSFWCFKGLMDRMADGFMLKINSRKQTSNHPRGIQKHLSILADLIRQTDGKFYSYLKSKDCLSMLFCFRWLLIIFKREFELNELKPMWEAVWSDYYSSTYQLFIALAILRRTRKHITVSYTHLTLPTILRV
eukprot:TRINITY_DN1830_c0_g1_i8.p1 TRINITY_DN1830_c0_g1~~TRINITY_DN1830_c0_g1_i8.p1  ORF type:complete len:604 (-),score=141.42 TRINITY_DN1830_c0_g1_i8:24-1835(-)